MKNEATFLDWLGGASIYVGYARYAQLGGHGFVCASNYDDSDELQRWIEYLDAGDIDALEAANRIASSGAWYANDENPALAMEKLVEQMRRYYFDVLNKG